jgi:hypothetical protein
MADNIQVFKPGWRALDANGDVYSGAVIHFFNAGTSNTRTVYSNYGLSTSLGTTVTCDSGGFPTSDGNSKVEVYTGSTPYKITLKDSAGTTIWTLDNIKAALDTSGFLTDGDVTPNFPLTNSSANQSLVVGDSGKYLNLNCSGGDITVTFDDAATLTDGWNITVRHDGTANQLLFVADGSEVFKIPGHAGVSAFAATNRGQAYQFICDGTGFKVNQVAPALFNTTGVILVADRVSSPPAAEAGARYIVGAAPSGAWSGFAQHDIAEATGQSTWFNITPPTNSGWMAYVQDEARHYFHYTSGWEIQANKQGAMFYTTQSGAISAAATLDITIPSDADELEIILWNIIPATDGAFPWLRVSQSGVFLTGATNYQYQYLQSASSARSNGNTEMVLSTAIGTAADERWGGSIRVFKPNAASTYKQFTWHMTGRQSDANIYVAVGAGELQHNANAIDGVRFMMSTGNIASGAYAVMARRYS